MAVLWYVLLLALLLASLLLTALDYPGTWIMVLAVFGYYHVTAGAFFGKTALIALCALAIAAELADWKMGAGAGAKRAGARWRGKLGGTLGGVLGGMFLTFLFPVPILGTIIGICAGCFLGSMLFELAGGREADQALAIGVGTAKGRFVGIFIKVAFGFAILLFSIYAGFPYRFGRHAILPVAAPVDRQATTR